MLFYLPSLRKKNIPCFYYLLEKAVEKYLRDADNNLTDEDNITANSFYEKVLYAKNVNWEYKGRHSTVQLGRGTI